MTINTHSHTHTFYSRIYIKFIIITDKFLFENKSKNENPSLIEWAEYFFCFFCFFSLTLIEIACLNKKHNYIFIFDHCFFLYKFHSKLCIGFCLYHLFFSSSFRSCINCFFLSFFLAFSSTTHTHSSFFIITITFSAHFTLKQTTHTNTLTKPEAFNLYIFFRFSKHCNSVFFTPKKTNCEMCNFHNFTINH